MTAFQISVVENFGSEESKRFFGQVYKALSSFCIIGVSGLVVLAKPIASILYQKDFFSAWSISCVLIFSVLFHALSGCLGTIYTSAKKTKFLFYSTGIGAIVNIILNVILIYWLGIIGAAIATLISNAVVWFSRLINSRKLIAFPINILTDSLSFVLIVVQIFLVIQDQLYCYIGAIGLLIIILAINVWTFLSSGILSRLKNKSIEAREE